MTVSFEWLDRMNLAYTIEGEKFLPSLQATVDADNDNLLDSESKVTLVTLLHSLAHGDVERAILPTELIMDLPVDELLSSRCPLSRLVVMLTEPIDFVDRDLGLKQVIHGLYFHSDQEGSAPRAFYLVKVFSPRGHVYMFPVPFPITRDKDVHNLFQGLAGRVLTFLNSRNVELVRADTVTGRSQKYIGQMVKRERKPFYITQVTIHQKRYPQKPNSVAPRGYDHAFTVRGFFRHLKADRYKEKRTLWVPEFIKGDGVWMPKTYNFVVNKVV